MDYLEFIARVTSQIPDKGQVMVRYYGLYGNAHRGKIEKASLAAFPLRIVKDKLRHKPKLEMVDDFVHNRIVRIEGNDFHLSATLWAGQGVDFINLGGHHSLDSKEA
jgi:hypothetical protein